MATHPRGHGAVVLGGDEGGGQEGSTVEAGLERDLGSETREEADGVDGVGALPRRGCPCAGEEAVAGPALVNGLRGHGCDGGPELDDGVGGVPGVVGEESHVHDHGDEIRVLRVYVAAPELPSLDLLVVGRDALGRDPDLDLLRISVGALEILREIF